MSKVILQRIRVASGEVAAVFAKLVDDGSGQAAEGPNDGDAVVANTSDHEAFFRAFAEHAFREGGPRIYESEDAAVRDLAAGGYELIWDDDGLLGDTDEPPCN